MTVPTISGVTVAPTSMSAVDSFYVTCGFAVQPDMAFCEVGDAVRRMSISNTTGSASFYAWQVGTGVHTVSVYAVAGTESDQDP